MMLHNLKIPDEWQKALLDLQAAGFKEAVINGGALRDLVLGKTHRVKDLDIASLDQRPYKYPKDWWIEKLYSPDSAYHCIPGMQRVVEYKVGGIEQSVQTTHWDHSPEWFARTIVNSNDFGINQIAWDGKRFIYTPAFERDVQSKTFTALKFKVIKQAQNAIKRANNWKYSGDYQGFTFDVSRAERFIECHKDPVEVIISDL